MEVFIPEAQVRSPAMAKPLLLGLRLGHSSLIPTLVSPMHSPKVPDSQPTHLACDPLLGGKQSRLGSSCYLSSSVGV